MSSFTPTHEWQDVPPGTVLPARCEIRFDFKTEKTQARLANGGGEVNGAAADPDFDQTYAQADAWPEPIPLYAAHETPEPYPVDALPPIIRAAAESYQAFGQQPIEMVACSALSAASLACQGLADIDRDNNLRGPCSLSSLCVAVSGERKTSCDRRMRRELDRWEKSKTAEQAPVIEAAERRLAIWQAERDGMLAKVKRLAGSLKDKEIDERDQLKSKLLLPDSDRPKIPTPVKLFYQDVTPEKLAGMLSVGWPSASLWSDEAGLIVGSHAMSEDSALRFLGLLNVLWDGGTFDRQREMRRRSYPRSPVHVGADAAAVRPRQADLGRRRPGSRRRRARPLPDGLAGQHHRQPVLSRGRPQFSGACGV